MLKQRVPQLCSRPLQHVVPQAAGARVGEGGAGWQDAPKSITVLTDSVSCYALLLQRECAIVAERCLGYVHVCAGMKKGQHIGPPLVA